MKMLFSVSTIILGMTVLDISQAYGQNYPNKPVRIVTSGAGGGPDFVARLTAIGLTPGFGQHVIVDNRASGTIPGEIVSKAPPDGHTLLVTSGILWTGPLLDPKAPYDPVKDFLPVTLTGTLANILIVHPALPAASVRELINLAKARPGKLNYASSSVGSSSHLAAELFRSMTGIDIVQVNYKGAGPALTGVVTGEVQIAFANAASVVAHVKSGRLKALAIGSAEPSQLAPGLPTISASGVPGYESVQVVGVFAPARTPAAIVDRLNHEIVRVLNRADVKEKLFNAGVEVVGSSPKEFAARITSEMVRLGKVIRDAGIRPE